ncbi:MAG TPA: class I SAM-dependent methyltransferase [Spirochaetia bacterium]|nr:class I SAM-dependent methyltransferase [Spirochaetia bacterium]
MPKTYSSVPGKERQETIGCPLCGSTRSGLYLPCDGFAFVRCQDCAVVYQNPRPVFDDLRRRYAQDYFDYELSNEAAFYRLMRLGMADVHFKERTAFFPAPKRFLDIGCATGMLIEAMQKEGWETRGVDICRESAEYGMRHRGVDIFVGTLEEAHIPDNYYHVVHFSHLIEHVPDPRGFLEEVKRILAPGGFAAITTPNVDGLQARLFGKAWRSAIADHLVLFSRKTLGTLIAETGFDIQQSVTWGGLAQGTAAPLVKVPVDRLAKRLGFGDVVMYLAAKRN